MARFAWARRVRAWRAVGAVVALSAAAQAADVRVDFATRNSTTNPGPFSSGASATFSGWFRIDDSVIPTGSTPTWLGALDDLVIQVNDTTLGQFSITAQNGRWQQLQSGNGQTDFLLGGWGGVSGGSIPMFSVVNGGISTTPFVLEEISFEFRGPALFPDTGTLPAAALHLDDFSFLDLSFSFSNPDVEGSTLRTTIIRTAAFDSLDMTPVPEPASVAMLLAGLAVLGGALRLRRR